MHAACQYHLTLHILTYCKVMVYGRSFVRLEALKRATTMLFPEAVLIFT
jgi:hypothetical protein